MPMVDGTVGMFFARAASTSRMRWTRASLSGSTDSAKRPLDCVYSWAQNTRVSGGRVLNFAREVTICWGVPSNSRPQPMANRVSPQNRASDPSNQKAIWPRVWPGTS